MAAKPNRPPMPILRRWLADLEAAIAANDRATIRARLKEMVPGSGPAVEEGSFESLAELQEPQLR